MWTPVLCTDQASTNLDHRSESVCIVACFVQEEWMVDDVIA